MYQNFHQSSFFYEFLFCIKKSIWVPFFQKKWLWVMVHNNKNIEDFTLAFVKAIGQMIFWFFIFDENPFIADTRERLIISDISDQVSVVTVAFSKFFKNTFEKKGNFFQNSILYNLAKILLVYWKGHNLWPTKFFLVWLCYSFYFFLVRSLPPFIYRQDYNIIPQKNIKT